ncbi:chloride channel protein CLC-f isoform X1 [Ricinus communis]|uniref:Chloride channel protein n=1 Tax=Ricinus communis TaxID=3988 RepID=B9ST82_RICCO|nr:chloride channel protein CLC-f isoform X1 [Ricinus communis]EEF33157.1 voltage-gated clc-type chloride channel, putative [Ricinus communis]|eukprot:XP_002529201.1 chloride channel protein CLC-f [Ricinus communis]
MKGGEYSDENLLLRSRDDVNENHDVIDDNDDLEGGQLIATANSPGSSGGGAAGVIKDLFLKHLDRGLSGRRLSSFKRIDSSRDSPKPSLIHNHNLNHNRNDNDDDDVLADSAPPEWVLLLIGCLLGLASGLCVAAFNKGVHVIHEWAWAGTPTEGAAWLRIQRLADTWHRILLIPVTGGVIVGMMHGLVEILNQIRQTSSSQRQGIDMVAGVFPTIKAIQAAVALGTGCSLGPEGPSVDIGKSCANGMLLMMENNREREITLVAAGAAAGIASGFNAAVAGCFFAIETVLRPRRAENSPPFTTAMIILASVISSTVSNVLLGTQSAFTVPPYDLKSAAELPLYLILGMLCGVVSVAFTRLVSWFIKSFDFIKEKFGLPAVVCPALGGLGAGIIALRYPGILYWGFTNVEEILHTGKSASAPGIWLLTQLAVAKVVATALCKGSGLVGGLYAPSLMIGAAIGAVFGGSAAEVINSAIPGNAAVAQPQAYALVGMAATLASVCSVPLTSVLLLFELTKDYRIILPLMGAVGLAIWVPSVTNQAKETEASSTRTLTRGYSSLSNSEDKNEIWRRIDDGDDLELSVIENASDHEAINEDLLLDDLKVSRAMSKNFVKVLGASTLKEAVDCMHESKQNCVLVVDDEDLLEGILTYGDFRRLSNKSDEATIGESAIKDVNTCLVSSVCTRGISYRGQGRGLLTCYPDTDLAIAKELMEAKGIKQLPVVKRGRGSWKERKRRVVAILHYDSIRSCLREEIARRKSIYQHRKDSSLNKMIESGH